MYRVKKLSVRLKLGGEEITILPPSMELIDRMTGASPSETAALLTGRDLSETDSLMVCEAVSEVLADAMSRPELAIPYYPDKKDDVPYDLFTSAEKIIAEYAKMSIDEVYRLDIYDYRMLLRDAVICNKMQTDEGRKWLRNAHRLTQTAPDMEKLRKKFDIRKVAAKHGTEEKR